jgi:pantetheine-phosphate adenylyltransferase
MTARGERGCEKVLLSSAVIESPSRIEHVHASDGVKIAYLELGDGPPIVFASSIFGDAPPLPNRMAPGKTAGVTRALYPGSFDPLHLGHLAVIEKAATMFDHVVVAVVGNPGKRSGLFALTDRVAMIDQATNSLANVSSEIHHGLTVDIARKTGSDVVIRTGHKDKGDEWSMLAMNELMSGTKTCFMPPPPELMFLSSSLVRSLLAHDRLSDAKRFLPPPVASALGAP